MRVKLRNGGSSREKWEPVSNSSSGSGGDTALAEISSKYAKSRPGRPRGLSITTGGWHSVQNLWICKRRPGIKTRYNLPSPSFLCSRFLVSLVNLLVPRHRNVSNGISSPRILCSLPYLATCQLFRILIARYYFSIYFANIFATLSKIVAQRKFFVCTSKWVTDKRGKMFTLQSVIRFFPCRISIRISFTACV